MERLLAPGQRLFLEHGDLPCVVEDFIGGGGQGEVFRGRLDTTAVAIKWYYPAAATPEQRASLRALVQRGAPSDRFLWPLDIARAPGTGGYGYVMPLRPARFRSFNDLISRRVEPSFRALITAGVEVAHAFLQLHARGLCYRDISFGNGFFEPASGRVLICDNDNVGINGGSDSLVLGTPRFMAPEVIRGESLPHAATDLHSLAVLLFAMLTLHHPLEGLRESAFPTMDRAAILRLYGTEPLFIFDPDDDANRPDPRYHEVVLNFWPLYPPWLQALFMQAFTEGLRNPARRVREGQWRAALARLRDCIAQCPACGAENFLPEEDAVACWSCGTETPRPPRLRIGRYAVLLSRDARLYFHHIDPRGTGDPLREVAAVRPHPRIAGVWGLANTGTTPWRVDMPHGTTVDVPPGKAVTLRPGLRLVFGEAEGSVEA